MITILKNDDDGNLVTQLGAVFEIIKQDAQLTQAIAYNDKLITVDQVHVGTGEECDEPHWHANGSTVTTTDGTVIEDPDPDGCGFGKVSEVPVVNAAAVCYIISDNDLDIGDNPNNCPVLTDADDTVGKIKINGLPLGIYILIEKVAPFGFAPSDQSSQIVTLDSNTPDLNAIVTITNNPIADLSITKDIVLNSAAEGVIVYQATVTNDGPNTALDVIVNDISPGLTFNAKRSSKSCSIQVEDLFIPPEETGDAPPLDFGNVVTCSLGDMLAGSSRQVFIAFNLVSGAGEIENIASVESDTLDPDESNNHTSITNSIQEQTGTITIFKLNPQINFVDDSGTTFVITPDPLTGSGSMTVIDDGMNDDSTVTGIVEIRNAKFGKYTATETVPPEGFQIASNPTQTDLVLDASRLNLIIVFIDTLVADETPEVNEPPVAHAGSDQTVDEGSPVPLIGFDSFDPNGTELTFSWTQTAGPTVALMGADTSVPVFIAPSVSADTTLTFSLVVNDGTFDSAPDTVNVNVVNVPLGTIIILKNDTNGNFVNIPGTTYKITPNPLTGADSLTVVDNGDNDEDPAVAITKVSSVLPGVYEIEETATSEGLIALSHSTLIIIGKFSQNTTVVFVNAVQAVVNDLPPTQAEAPVISQGEASTFIENIVSIAGLTITTVEEMIAALPASLVVGEDHEGEVEPPTPVEFDKPLATDFTAKEIFANYDIPSYSGVEQAIAGDTTLIPPLFIAQDVNGDTVVLSPPISDTFTDGTIGIKIDEDHTPTGIGDLSLDIPLDANGNDIGFAIKLDTLPPPEIITPPVATTLFIDIDPVGTVTGGETAEDHFAREEQTDIPLKFVVDNFDPTEDVVIFLLDEKNNTWIQVGIAGCTVRADGITADCSINLPHLSKFSVGGVKKPTSGGGGGGYAYVVADSKEPIIAEYYWEPEIASVGSNVTITARIVDDVGIKQSAVFYYGAKENLTSAKVVSMKKLSTEWFTMDIPSSDVKEPGLSFLIVAVDTAGNSVTSATEYLDIKQAPPMPKTETKKTNAPTRVTESLKPKPVLPPPRLELISMNGGDVVKSFPDKIIIRNTSNSTIGNVRIILSPEISKSFRFNEWAIKSIGPLGNVTLNFEIIGNPNKDMLGGLTAYEGKIIVMAEHHYPIELPVDIGAKESYFLSDYTDRIAAIADQRYSKVWLVNSILPKQNNNSDNYEVTTSSKDNTITDASDELVIRNLSDKQLTNVRIYLNSLSRAFLLEHNVIQTLEPNAQISIKLIPKFNTESAYKDIKGKLLIAPANDLPMEITVNIVGVQEIDSKEEYEVRTMNNNVIKTAVDEITISNIADRPMDSVKIALSDNLSKVFTLSNETFKHIQPGEKVVAELKYNVNDIRTFMQDYTGELLVLSEHHNPTEIPIKIEWKKISGKNFDVYARSGDESLANNLVKMLDSNYENIAARFGAMNSKTVIYMTGSMQEMKLINESGRSYYSHANDTIFICSCDEPDHNALKEFVSRLLINNYATYHHIQKFAFDQENWLLDGLTGYIATDMIDTGLPEKYFDALDSAIDTIDVNDDANDKIDFRWRGSYSDAQYGATYTFFEFLEEKYGMDIIDKAPEYLRSGMISNHRCSTLEECVIIRAAYEVSGLDMSNKRLTLSFDTLAKEYDDYLKVHYKFEPNALQKAELEKALAKQKAGLPLTACEEGILELAKYVKSWARSLNLVN
jgi:uncharacterized repeat protein (TIGR01451 family)